MKRLNFNLVKRLDKPENLSPPTNASANCVPPNQLSEKSSHQSRCFPISISTICWQKAFAHGFGDINKNV
jgi:hypothetical protein